MDLMMYQLGTNSHKIQRFMESDTYSIGHHTNVEGNKHCKRSGGSETKRVSPSMFDFFFNIIQFSRKNGQHKRFAPPPLVEIEPPFGKSRICH